MKHDFDSAGRKLFIMKIEQKKFIVCESVSGNQAVVEAPDSTHEQAWKEAIEQLHYNLDNHSQS